MKQNRQKGLWGDINKPPGFRQDHNKDHEKTKFPPKKFGGQKPQQNYQLFNAEQAEDSSGSGKNPDVF